MQKRQVKKIIENIFISDHEYFDGIKSLDLKTKLQRTHGATTSVEMLNEVGSELSGFMNGGKELNFNPSDKWWSVR